MTLLEKYKKEICPYCTHKNKCNIGQNNDTTKCDGYEKDKKKLKTRKKPVTCWQGW